MQRRMQVITWLLLTSGFTPAPRSSWHESGPYWQHSHRNPVTQQVPGSATTVGSSIHNVPALAPSLSLVPVQQERPLTLLCANAPSTLTTHRATHTQQASRLREPTQDKCPPALGRQASAPRRRSSLRRDAAPPSATRSAPTAPRRGVSRSTAATGRSLGHRQPANPPLARARAGDKVHSPFPWPRLAAEAPTSPRRRLAGWNRRRRGAARVPRARLQPLLGGSGRRALAARRHGGQTKRGAAPGGLGAGQPRTKYSQKSSSSSSSGTASTSPTFHPVCRPKDRAALPSSTGQIGTAAACPVAGRPSSPAAHPDHLSGPLLPGLEWGPCRRPPTRPDWPPAQRPPARRDMARFSLGPYTRQARPGAAAEEGAGGARGEASCGARTAGTRGGEGRASSNAEQVWERRTALRSGAGPRARRPRTPQRTGRPATRDGASGGGRDADETGDEETRGRDGGTRRGTRQRRDADKAEVRLSVPPGLAGLVDHGPNRGAAARQHARPLARRPRAGLVSSASNGALKPARSIAEPLLPPPAAIWRGAGGGGGGWVGGWVGRGGTQTKTGGATPGPGTSP